MGARTLDHVRTEAADTPGFSVLFVCTGNVCRSPLAERLAEAYLRETLGVQASTVTVSSAGTRAVVGAAMHRDSALVLQGLGGKCVRFRARQLTADLLADADLVLTMTRSQRSAVLEAAPRVMSRTFTLREAAELVAILDDAASNTGASPSARARGWVQALSVIRSRRRGGAADDIRDPIGQPPEVHQEVGEAIAAALLPVLDRLVAVLRNTTDGPSS